MKKRLNFFPQSKHKKWIKLKRLSLKKDLNIALEKSWVIGDSTRDILTAQNAGMKSILVQTGHAGKDGGFEVNPDFVAKDLNKAVKLILKEVGRDDC